MRIRLAVLVPLMVMLVSCGGGGGGGGGGGSGGLTFTLDRSSLNFTFEESTQPPEQTVTATATGNFSGTLYIGAVVEGQGIDPNIFASISGHAGLLPDRTGAAKLQRTRSEVVRGWNVVRELLLAEGRHQLADQVSRFVSQMSAPRTEKQWLAFELIARARPSRTRDDPFVR